MKLSQNFKIVRRYYRQNDLHHFQDPIQVVMHNHMELAIKRVVNAVLPQA